MSVSYEVLEYARIGNSEGLKNIAGLASLSNVQDENGNNALLLAAIHGHAPVVKILIDAGYSIYASGNTGHIPLIAAAMNCHKDVVETILDHSKKITRRKNPSVAAVIAANSLEVRGHKDIADLLRSNPG